MSQSGVVYRINPYTGKSTWTYGNWGGGGWSNGEFTPPGQSPDFTGVTLSKLDETFRSHDQQYQLAQDAYKLSSGSDADKAAYWDAIIQADRDMLRAINDLRKSGELGNPPGVNTPASPDYVAAAQATLAFWLVLQERQKSRDMLADPSRQYEDGDWRAPLPQEIPNPNGPLPEDPWFGSLPPDALIDELADAFNNAQTQTSPIILDLDGNGVQTVGLGAGVHFDHDANGFAQKSGWVGQGDGLLVWDINDNGQIDNGRELFGDHTKLANGLRAVNGFEALAQHDSNADGRIDAQDAIWQHLRVWVDADANAQARQGEFKTLDQLGIQSINLAYTHSSHVDEHGLLAANQAHWRQAA